MTATATVAAAANNTGLAGGAWQQELEAQDREDAGHGVPPQHERVKVSDFSLVRTLGTGTCTIKLLAFPLCRRSMLSIDVVLFPLCSPFALSYLPTYLLSLVWAVSW
jgi:hypothetical protein